MKIDELKRKATITDSGAVLLGKYLACDGFEVKRLVGGISHAHGDHIQKFETALGFYESILLTPATKDLLEALKGSWLRRRRNLTAIPYKKALDIEDERVTLYPAHHMLGSAQFLIENYEGTRILYTGDFRPPTRPIQTDVLVIQATYGKPTDIRTYERNDVITELVSHVKSELEQGPVCILASRGKLQEVMNILSEEGIQVPFLCPTKVFDFSQVYKKYGIEMGDILQIGKEEAEEILRRNDPHVAFHPLRSRIPREDIYVKVIVSGWDTTVPFFRKAFKEEYVATLSDHADFNGLLEYVKESKPKLVIIDNLRCANAASFAKEVKKRLGIDAKPLPY